MADSRPTGVVRARAFAKINLTLRVIGTRNDGYHELQTRFQSIALHDTLTFTAGPGPFHIECNDPDCPVNETNLVWRAAQRMWRLKGRRSRLAGLAVRIVKRIPMQTGLGGGSSDAAATIRALAALWRIRMRAPRVGQMAADLGADVPFFLEGGTALGVERGDVLVRMKDEQRAWVVLALPAFGVSSLDAYRWWDDDNPVGTSSPPDQEFRNDLESCVARRHPQIARLIKGLERAGASRAAMSGSGSAVFGLFDTRGTAQAAAAAIAGRSHRTLVTRTIGRARFSAMSRPTFIDSSSVRGKRTL